MHSTPALATFRRTTQMIEEIFNDHNGRYGSPRIKAALRREGRLCSRKGVERIMRVKGLRARSKRRFRPKTTDSRHPHPVAPNRLQSRAETQALNEVWVQDIIYLPTAEGWVYLAGVLDLHSRRLIGCSMQESLETCLPVGASEMTLQERGHPRELIHHSDRGCQNASQEYRTVLAESGLLASISRKDNCYDKAGLHDFLRKVS